MGKLMLKANIALLIENNRLVPAGRGFQPTAKFNRGDIIAPNDGAIDEYDWQGRCWVKLDGKIYGVCHSDYTECDEP
jgi:hypothetical protein